MTLTLGCAAARFPRRFKSSVLAIDAHTEGEPLRVLVEGDRASGFTEPIGTTMLEKRAWAMQHADQLRQQLMLEPRGHADMYGCWLTKPTSDDGDVGVLFLHNEGFSTMCGHGIIGLVKVGLTYDLFSTAEPDVVRIDTPAGRVLAQAHRDQQTNAILSVSFLNVPSFVLDADAEVSVPGMAAPLRYDLAFGGAYYAYVEASDVGLELGPKHQPAIVDMGKRIKAAVSDQHPIRHPDSPSGGSDLDFLYGAIFVGHAQDPANHSRNVCVFAEGEVDRSPTGTGVSGRAAIEVRAGRAAIGNDQPALLIESILGTTFSVRAAAIATVGSGPTELQAIVPRVEGRAWITGINEFVIDPLDDLKHGFLLR